MSKIIPFTGITKLDLPADRVLEQAEGKMEGVVIMGYTTEGEEFYASSYADGGTVLWLAERLKTMLMNGIEGIE